MNSLNTIKPMLCTPNGEAFDDPKWTFEPKLDGLRATVAISEDSTVHIFTRGGQDITAAFPEIVNVLKNEKLTDTILDGEIVVLDSDGKPNFNMLQNRSGITKKHFIASAVRNSTAVLYVFDIPKVLGHDITKTELKDRLAILESTLSELTGQTTVRKVASVAGSGIAMWQSCQAMGLEGMVAKRLASQYQPGKRSRDWVKCKRIETHDYVVYGFTEGTGSRQATFGALMVGLLKDGEYVPVGKVGSGFTELECRQISRMMETVGQTKIDGEDVTLVVPSMVVECKFMEHTESGKLRQPIFVRLRGDKKPEDCE